jgi:hypothetical protein
VADVELVEVSGRINSLVFRGVERLQVAVTPA